MLPLPAAPDRSVQPTRPKSPPSLKALTVICALAAWVGSGCTRPPQACDLKFSDRISCGEEMLVPQVLADTPPPPEKQQGIDAFAQQNYQEAYRLLDAAWRQQRDPETLIYRNNAWIQFGVPQPRRYTIAVVVPLPTPNQSYDLGLEILRGVAQAQDDAVHQQKLNLQVMIADDGNTDTQAQNIAHTLVKLDLMAVVGHYASEITLSALPIYQQHQLPLISPSSTSTKLTAWGNEPDHVFFRTVNTTQQHAEGLSRYLNQAVSQPKVAVFYNHSPNSQFSQSMKEQFVKLLPPAQVLTPPEFNLADPSFNPTVMLQRAQQQGANALAIFPDGQTSSNTFQNALNLIAANQGQFTIVGANTLHSFELLNQVGQDATQRFTLAVLWHSLQSPDATFPRTAEVFWGGMVGGRTAGAFDAVQVLSTAFKQAPEDRVALQRILAAPNFKAYGATGEISFNQSDRREDTTVLVKVVRQCAKTGYRFVPIEFEPACYQGLE